MSVHDEAEAMNHDLDDSQQVQSPSQTGSVVKLCVGPTLQQFEVPEDLLCRKCPYFLSAFQGNFVEAKTKTFAFPDDDPSRFADLCKWMETGSIYGVQQHSTWKWLAQTWLFGDKYHIDELQNEVVDALHTKFAAHEEGVNVSFETLDYVAENTYARSPLRRIFADMLTNGISLQQLPSRVEHIPSEFLQDMCIGFKTMTSRNGPTNISLLTNPISSYYTSSVACKSTAMPKEMNPLDEPTDIYCDGADCLEQESPQPIRDTMHLCSYHNIKLCNDCRHTHRGHRKKMVSLITAPYRSTVTGSQATIIDGQINDSGFYCDGPKCDPDSRGFAHYEHWALMSGDRYHCLDCHNTDYCSVCIRGPLKCKEDGHSMLRIRPTFAKKVVLTEELSIKVKQGRLDKGVCWRCAEAGHATKDCEAKEATLGVGVEVED